MTPVLQVNNLRSYFFEGGRFTRAVDGVSLDLDQGGRLGIAGQSGSGKTQTLMSIAGLVEGRPGVVGGEIIFDGANLYEGLNEQVDIRENEEGLLIRKDEKRWSRQLEENYAGVRGRHVGVIFQEPKSALVPYQTIERQMREAADAVYDRPGSFDRSRALSIFESMRFDDPARILASYPHQISGGESQRATIGIVLESDPELLLADEPTSSLDPESADSVLELLDDVVTEGGKSMIFVTHSADILQDMVDHVAIMYAGTVLEYGSTQAIVHESDGAVHPYTGQLVAAGLGRHESTTVSRRDPILIADRGCPYQFSCPLKKRLGAAVQIKCERDRPQPVTLGANHWAACWGLEASS